MLSCHGRALPAAGAAAGETEALWEWCRCRSRVRAGTEVQLGLGFGPGVCPRSLKAKKKNKKKNPMKRKQAKKSQKIKIKNSPQTTSLLSKQPHIALAWNWRSRGALQGKRGRSCSVRGPGSSAAHGAQSSHSAAGSGQLLAGCTWSGSSNLL